MFRRSRQFSLLPEYEPKIVLRLGMIGTEADRCFQRRPRAIDITSPPARRAEMVLCVEQIRLELHCPREVIERGLCLPELSLDVAEAIVRDGEIRRPLQGTFVRIGCSGEIVRALLRPAEFDKGFRRRTVSLRRCMTFLCGSGDAERPGEEHPRCTRRTAEHSRILAPASQGRTAGPAARRAGSCD